MKLTTRTSRPKMIIFFFWLSSVFAQLFYDFSPTFFREIMMGALAYLDSQNWVSISKRKKGKLIPIAFSSEKYHFELVFHVGNK